MKKTIMIPDEVLLALSLKGGGGGGDSTFAFVSFTYVVGTVVTATKGTTTLTSDDSGYFVFALPESGDWVFTDGVNSKTISVNTYGIGIHTSFSLLKYSNVENIIAEARLDNFDALSDKWGGFDVNTGLQQKVDGDRDVVYAPLSTYLKKELGTAQNQVFTAYLVFKMTADVSYGRIISSPYNDVENNDNCPCWLKVNNTACYGRIGSEASSGINPYSGYHVYALNLNGSGTLRACIDGLWVRTYSYTNGGNKVWMTYSTSRGEHSAGNILFAGVVNTQESDQVVISNCNALKEYFNL